MSTEAEFTRWLHRPEKTFTENLQFALKAWKSADFMLASKYEVILKWLSEQGVAQIGTTVETLQEAELTELLQLKCQPGLIEKQVKVHFVFMWLEFAKSKWQETNTRILPELLQQLIEFEIVQDLYHVCYQLYAELVGQLLQSYENYLIDITEDKFMTTHETDFFMKILNTFKESAKKAGNVKEFELEYRSHVLQPLVQVLLTFQQRKLNFFNDVLELEQLLCQGISEIGLLQRILELPRHVCLLTLECAIVNHRGVEIFQQKLLEKILEPLLEENDQDDDAALKLTIASYTLDIFRKHDITTSFKMSAMHTGLTYLGHKIFIIVKKFRELYLQQVLQLLCATLRLNPLILESDIFQLTTWMIVADKQTAREQQLFEEFLVLLMDMFRKLSRAEKFVVNLLKVLREWLQQFNLTKSKRKHFDAVNAQEEETSIVTPIKKSKLDNTAPITADEMDSTETTSDNVNIEHYLAIMFKEFNTASQPIQPSAKVLNTKIQSFPYLQSAWPSKSVGVAFSKLIVGLMSKPSLVIWKSLIYSLQNILEVLQQEEETENLLFQLDFIAAMICQYFGGSKLAEQSEKSWKEIEELRQQTAGALANFGHFLLGQPHNKRTMSAFLECCYYATQFDLIVWYYRSDRHADDTPFLELSKQIHTFLTEEEWTLIVQRIINFGKINCKFALNRLLLQRTKARLLFSDKNKTLNLQKILLTPIANDLEQLELILKSVDAKWFVRNLKRDEKLEIINLLTHAKDFNFDSVQYCVEDLEFFELLCLGLYENLAENFVANTKKSILGGINFADLKITVDPASDKRVAIVADAINAKIDTYTIKKLPVESIEQTLKILNQLPIGHCRRQMKGIIFALHLALFHDLKAAQLEDLSTLAFEMFTDLLHFGQQIQIFKYFTIENMLRLLPVSTAWEFYEFLFSTMKNEEKDAERFLTSLMELLKSGQAAADKLDDDQVKLTLITIETLSSLTGPGAKRFKKYLDIVLNIYADHVNSFFVKIDGRNSKKDKRFVEEMLPGFAAYVKSTLAKHVAAKTELEEDFRRICKIFIGYSMNYRNAHAIKLITVALNNRQQLHFDQDEIEFVLNGYWQQINADLKIQQLEEKNAEAVIKLIISNKTNEDVLLILKEIDAKVVENDFSATTCLLVLIAKCPFSTVKGAIFNEQFKQITLALVMRLQKDELFQYIDKEQILNLLACQQAVMENKMIPVSYDTLDNILAFLMNINIKKYPLTDTNVKQFKSMHLAMSELCMALIKQRQLLLMDRVPQFMHVFKDLLQAIVLYKSERQNDNTLNSEEIDDLVDLVLKLEALMHIIATHSLEVKRVAPFVLTFIINLMVTNKRPTTLYPKIKTHIENICYDLIGICDHRVGRFILRCSNEAARQVYEVLVKDHKKYHKFKGKV